MKELEDLMYEASSTPMVESFHIALWYVLHYFSAVVDAADLLSWRVPLTVLVKKHMKVKSVDADVFSIGFGEELELLFRLSLCTPTWMRVRQIEERYAEYMHVGQALRQLTGPLVSFCFNEGANDEDKALVTVLDGKNVAAIVAKNEKNAAAEVLRTARVSELRQMILSMQMKIASLTGTSAQPSKEELIHFLIANLSGRHEKHSASLLAGAWNSLVGPVCRVHQRFKLSTQSISVLLYILTNHYSVGSVWDTSRHLSPVVTLLQLPRQLRVRQEFGQISVPLPPWWKKSNDSSSSCRDALSYQKSVFQPFSSREALASYTEALNLHQKLLEAAAGKNRAKHWSIDFAMKSHATVQHGLTQVPQLTVDEFQSLSKELGRKRERYPLDKNTISLEALLRQGGLVYEHLLPFLPKYRWYSCVELLVPMLQYHKKWCLANELLHKLLDEPVYTVKSSCGTVTLSFLYRYQKRGEWYYRLAQNLIHLNDKKSALVILEAQQQNWRHLHPYHTAQHTIHVGNPQDLPTSIQRRARLLCALFRFSDNPKELALQNAVWEFHRQHFFRRGDRISIERTLASLHRTLRRWTPLPPSYMSFTNSLQVVTTVTVRAARDSNDSTLWRYPTLPSASCRVEAHVLRWFIYSRRERNEKWTGVHCEGRWVAYLARLLLWEAYTYDPDHRENKGHHPSYVWLSPFQDGPLDLISSGAFIERRRHIIEERLNYFEQCPRDALIEYVRQRCRGGDGMIVLDREVGEALDDAKTATMAAASQAQHVERIGSGEISLLSASGDEEDEGEEGSIMPGQLSPQRIKEQPSFPVWQTLDVSGFPLLSLLRAVPQRPLCALLRLLFLSPSESGFSIRFSSFPDLVMWCETPSVLGDTKFMLSEVKSPNDELSDNQFAVLDMLSRCGFDVTVTRVVDVGQNSRSRRIQSLITTN